MAAADVGRACAQNRALCALRSAGAEFQHRPALRGADDAVCLGSDQALVVEDEQDIRLDELRLDGGCADGQDRLAREDRRALRHGEDVAREAEIAQVGEEVLVKDAAAAQVGDVLFGKMQVADVVDHLLQPCRDGEAAAVGDVAVKDVEIADAVTHPVAEIAVAHRQLVEVAEHGHVELVVSVHSAPRLFHFVPIILLFASNDNPPRCRIFH